MSDNQDQGSGQGSSISDVLSSFGSAIGTLATGQQTYPGPGRVVVGNRGMGVPAIYTGPNLVDENNQVTNLTAYDTSEEYAKYVYGSLSPERRAQIFSILKQKGFYGGRDVGFYANDITAIQGWLDYSNTIRYTSGRALQEMQKNLPNFGGGGGGYRPRFRVSAAEDLKVVANQVAKQTLGREFTTDEAAKFVSAYQQREVQAQKAAMSGGTYSEAPAADVMAQQFAQQVAPSEANGYKFLGLMNRIFSATTGGR